MFNLADAWGWYPSGKNPCRFVPRYKVERHHERFLTPEELYRLGRALDAVPSKRLASTHTAAAIRLLVLTGRRRNEILGLRWEDLDFDAGEIRLADSKTGARVVPPPAAKVLGGGGLSPVAGNRWVFPGRKEGDRQHNINDSWDRVRKRAGLAGVRLHDLRHSFASRALALRESLSMIGKLLGHRKVQTTARYAHLARDSVRASTAKVAESIGADILPESRRRAEGKVSRSAVAALRLLMLTGCRRNEILTLRWEDVDLETGELRLRDAKTGARSVALSPAARKVLAALPRLPDNPWVIAGPRPDRRLSNLDGRWLVVRRRGGTRRRADPALRHSFASRALALGESLTMIGQLLGHRQVQTTARYAHLARGSVKTSAARVAGTIAADMEKLRTVSAV